MYQPALHGKQGFHILMRQLVQQIQITIADDDTFDFNAFDNMSPDMQEKMIKFAYLLHMRAQIGIGAKKIHQSLDAKVIRMRLGQELNKDSNNGPEQ